MTGGAMRACDPNSALMKAWADYQKSEDFANSVYWATTDQLTRQARADEMGISPDANRAKPEQREQHVKGALWAAFMAGFLVATERAAGLHESVNPASGDERIAKVPGAGAMGAVIEYRDLIRANLT